MQNFTQSASKLLLEYRNLIKKHYLVDNIQKLTAVGLNKKIPVNDADLYGMIAKIIHVEEQECLAIKPTLRYSGVSRFLDHLKEFIAEFRLLNGKVIHPGQASSRAILEVIQLLSLSIDRLNGEVSGRIENSLWLIAKFGDEMQKSQLFKALEKQIERQANYFTPLLNKYSHFLNLDHAAEVEEADEEEEEKIAC